eukprot:TRINITY_DN3053_c0_g2_i9.p2 TRINITY_DN3053_c0_g2~~TRINITY_DN3053_c0_g2_i9.p2  ORF type:complete len:106 (+),score=21.47 TRINITY_DN3053_c0_g2_i9:24-320(+)
MIRRPPRSTHCISSAASDVYKRQIYRRAYKNSMKARHAVEFSPSQNNNILYECKNIYYFDAYCYCHKSLHKIYGTDNKRHNTNVVYKELHKQAYYYCF